MNETYFNRANKSYHEGQYMEAIAYYKQSIDYDEYVDETIAYYNIGCCYSKLSKHNLSIYYYRKAIDLGSQHPSHFHNLGIAYAEIGDYKKAYHIISYASTLDDTDDDILRSYTQITKVICKEII